MISTLLRSASAALLLAAGAGAGAHALQAQQQPPQQPYGEAEQPQIEPVSDTEVEAFVVAMNSASEVFEEYRPQLQSATDEQAAREIQTAASEEMTEAVIATGLEPERYNEIMAAARNDPQLTQRITDKADEMNGGSEQ